MALFQIYRVETNVVTVAEARDLSAYRLISFVYEHLGLKGGSEESHREDARRYPRVVGLMQKYHPFNESAPDGACMTETDAKILAADCGWPIPIMLGYAAAHWKKHDDALRAACGARSTP
jgi:hypothetical protein